MKAVVHTEYGSPDVLELREVAKPVPADGQVLVKVYAASVNRSDWEGLTGSPFYARLGGLRRPGREILGSDIAGRVEAAGANANEFQPGQDVFGLLPGYGGGFAEYACASERALAPKPAGMTFEEAAAIPQAAMIALQGIRDKGQVRPGQRVLISRCATIILMAYAIRNGSMPILYSRATALGASFVCSVENVW